MYHIRHIAFDVSLNITRIYINIVSQKAHAHFYAKRTEKTMIFLSDKNPTVQNARTIKRMKTGVPFGEAHKAVTTLSYPQLYQRKILNMADGTLSSLNRG